MKKSFVASVVAALCLMSTSAFATPITLNGSLTNGSTNSLLSNKTYNGTFNGASVLPSDYTLNSLSFSFVFTDDNDLVSKFLSTSSYGSASMVNGVWERDRTITNSTTWTGQKESVNLTVGGKGYGSKSTAAANSTDASDPVKGDRYRDGSRCVLFVFCDPQYTTDYTVTETITKDWTGTITYESTITDPTVIKNFLKNDLMNFSFSVDGDLYLTAAQLKLDITEAKAVPEPSSIALALVGLAGLGYTRRRAKRG